MADEKRILALDSQILDAIQKCPFYCYLHFVKNYKQDESIAPLERGGLGHILLEVYYKLLFRGSTWSDAVDQAITKGREHYQTLELNLQDAEWIIHTFREYAEYYRHDGIRIIGVEEVFSFVIHEDDELVILYEGKIDLEAEFPVIGVSVYDHKWRQQRANYSPLDNQLLGYSIAKKLNLVYINEVGLQTSYEPEKKFRRVPIPIGDGVKERWIKNTIYWAKILDYSFQSNIWPQSHLKTAPLGITQCEKCTYNRVCNSENEQEMARKIKDHFHIGEVWDIHNEETKIKV